MLIPAVQQSDSVIYVVVQLLSCVWPSAILWTAACQPSQSFTISWSLLKLMSMELMMPSNHLVLYWPTPSHTLSLSQDQGLFQWVGSLHQVAKVLEFSFCISPSNEYSMLISFRIDWFDLLAVQRTLKSLPQHHNLKFFHISFFILFFFIAY